MAHFAKLDENNVVTEIIVVSNDIATDETSGITFLKDLLKQPNANFKQTSYNTEGGVHKLGGTPFRKNYAAIGYTYDADKDAFIAPKPHNSWTLNETSCLWEAPISKPVTYDTFYKDLQNNPLKNIDVDFDTHQIIKVNDFNVFESDQYIWDEDNTNWIRDPQTWSVVTAENQVTFQTVNEDYLNSL